MTRERLDEIKAMCSTDAPSKILDALQDAVTEIERLKGIVNELRNFAYTNGCMTCKHDNTVTKMTGPCFACEDGKNYEFKYEEEK